MTTKVTARTPLSREEFASLQEIGKAMQRSILPAHRDLLISLEYIAPGDGGLRLTDAGRKRLAAGR
jgi:hypothetical protein